MFEVTFDGRYAAIPAHMKDQLRDWVELGTPPTSDWLRSIIKNDLRTAVKAADAEQRPHLELILDWLYNCAGVPSNCHGSYENYRDWRLKKKTPQVT